MVARPRLFAAALTLTTTPAAAECVEAPDAEDAGVVLMRCADGAILAIEAAAARSSVAAMGRHPGVMQLDVGALAVSLPPSAGPFKTLTPDLVATASAGEWAIVAEAATRAVLWSGALTLTRRVDGAETLVRPSEAVGTEERLARLRRALARAAP